MNCGRWYKLTESSLFLESDGNVTQTTLQPLVYHSAALTELSNEASGNKEERLPSQEILPPQIFEVNVIKILLKMTNVMSFSKPRCK